jgi:hypothetical protein
MLRQPSLLLHDYENYVCCLHRVYISTLWLLVLPTKRDILLTFSTDTYVRTYVRNVLFVILYVLIYILVN